MGVFLHPVQPDFATESEREAWKAIQAQLRDGDALIHGIRITDPVDGDIEIDLLVLLPEIGADGRDGAAGHRAGAVDDRDEGLPWELVVPAPTGSPASGHRGR